MKMSLPLSAQSVTKKLCGIILLLTLLLSGSCARRYYDIEPGKLTYTETDVKDDVAFSYRYKVLRNKYFNKETRKDIKLVAVKCTNNSDRDLVFGTDIQLMRESGRTADLAGNSYIFNQLRQKSASHLWWMLWGLFTVSLTETNGGGQPHTTTIPVGLVLGPALTLTNISTAINANRDFKAELKQNNLLGTTIRKGETVYGLAGVRTYKYEKLSLRDSVLGK